MLFSVFFSIGGMTYLAKYREGNVRGGGNIGWEMWVKLSGGRGEDNVIWGGRGGRRREL